MNKETQKILFAVLRVFVDDINRGNDNTLHAHEITNQVCRALHRRKEKEKKNTHTHVVTALRALKAKRILFEAIDDWSDDRLARPKSVEKRSAFGLTRPALEYLTDVEKLKEYSAKSDAALSAMLAEFGVITPKQKEISVVPAVLVETIQAIEQKENMANNEESPVASDNNVRRIAAEIKNFPFLSAFTPARLLGALRAINATSVESACSAADIGWEPHKIQNASPALAARGLVAWRHEVPLQPKNRAAATKRMGIYLTDLGRRVAEEGNFYDVIPDNERWSYSTQKQGIMLKNSKKSESVRPTGQPGQVTIRLPNGTTITGDVATAMEFYQRTGQSPPNAVEHDVKPTTNTLGVYETITAFVTDIARAAAASIERMSHAALPDGAVAEKVDPMSLSFAVTQATYIMHDLKYELAEVLCAAEDPNGVGGEIDMKRLQDYFAGIELAAEEILRGGSRSLPSLKPDARTTLPRIVKLPAGKNITPEYVGPHPTRRFKTADQRAAEVIKKNING